ncbi:hypothetical protein BB561_003796 [Smittium simulii]|uniref:Ubiquinone biosynthesis O-methyltransferase, mitochondrial n=1 Tax=Smittium simulii TaxID=133385 RepID=A0A2T9YJJ4_9FUNG|nr:hypothetical protein BB561_003796 [Smittium simulii]
MFITRNFKFTSARSISSYLTSFKRGYSSFNHEEVHKFSQLSQHWWDVNGPFKPLHAMNPARVSYISQMYSDLTKNYSYKNKKDLWNQSSESLSTAKIVDVGCGGGLLLGGNVLGIDASAENIHCAQEHAKDLLSGSEKPQLEYQNILAEDLVAKENQFDIVVSSEVIEHVNNYKLFLDSLTKLTRKNGLLVISTINRTILGKLLCVTLPEHILGMVPKGTHDFTKFIEPNEISSYLNRSGFKVVDISGLIYNPFANNWCVTPSNIGPFIDVTVQANYILAAVKVE